MNSGVSYKEALTQGYMPEIRIGERGGKFILTPEGNRRYLSQMSEVQRSNCQLPPVKEASRSMPGGKGKISLQYRMMKGPGGGMQPTKVVVQTENAFLRKTLTKSYHPGLKSPHVEKKIRPANVTKGTMLNVADHIVKVMAEAEPDTPLLKALSDNSGQIIGSGATSLASGLMDYKFGAGVGGTVRMALDGYGVASSLASGNMQDAADNSRRLADSALSAAMTSALGIPINIHIVGQFTF